ncbi:class I SAM-dependent methyltransferase [Methanoplanus sp. FWC-SCC4]|uniref:Class I SAM-dependent methyltransferase n=1 Tax=Methanochimaera problematica TaxID=2609417 RepID=A0AA97FCS0_9EURY|nr:class I SAM-dependent methyltransferase [Methanoplanus sp. FWC-SCC4]WOF17030.1 class I SAM-dependent methyltransferase [Methanoplanus sp. FWC-SCC4]
MSNYSTAWDEQYKKAGALWAGAARELPKVPEDSKVLELGCGNGKTAHELEKKGCFTYAVDFSGNAALLCRNKSSMPGRTEAFVADASVLPFKNETFDTIIAFHITGHSERENRYKISKEIQRVLKKNGTIHIAEFSTEDMRFGGGITTEENSFVKGNGIMTHFFLEEEIKNLFSWGKAVSVRTDRWEIKVRGVVHKRAEILASFIK